MDANVFVLYAILALLCGIVDVLLKIIPNLFVYPGIIVGCLLTGNWVHMVVAFFICAAFYELKFWGGGDVKLIAMVASFLGWLFLPILLTSVLLIKVYKKIFKVNNGIPVAPFVCVASVPFLLFNIPAILR